MRERHPIHRTGHVDVGKEHLNVDRLGFQYPQRLISIRRHKNLKPAIAQHGFGDHADQGFILDKDHADRRTFRISICHSKGKRTA